MHRMSLEPTAAELATFTDMKKILTWIGVDSELEQALGSLLGVQDFADEHPRSVAITSTDDYTAVCVCGSTFGYHGCPGATLSSTEGQDGVSAHGRADGVWYSID